MSNLIRWEPLPEIMSARDMLDRMLEDAFSRPRWTAGRLGSPSIDMVLADDESVVKGSLPGVKPDDVSLTLTGGPLTIRGSGQGAAGQGRGVLPPARTPIRELLPHPSSPDCRRRRQGQGRLRERHPDLHAPQGRGAQAEDHHRPGQVRVGLRKRPAGNADHGRGPRSESAGQGCLARPDALG